MSAARSCDIRFAGLRKGVRGSHAQPRKMRARFGIPMRSVFDAQGAVNAFVELPQRGEEVMRTCLSGRRGADCMSEVLPRRRFARVPVVLTSSSGIRTIRCKRPSLEPAREQLSCIHVHGHQWATLQPTAQALSFALHRVLKRKHVRARARTAAVLVVTGVSAAAVAAGAAGTDTHQHLL